MPVCVLLTLVCVAPVLYDFENHWLCLFFFFFFFLNKAVIGNQVIYISF